MTNSNRKGKSGERAWRDQLKSAGFDARRGQQYSGNPDAPDVVCPELDWLHPEVKRVERLNIHDAMDQAVNDAGDKTPYVAHRRNRKPWLVTMLAKDWLLLMRMLRCVDKAYSREVE